MIDSVPFEAESWLLAHRAVNFDFGACRCIVSQFEETCSGLHFVACAAHETQGKRFPGAKGWLKTA